MRRVSLPLVGGRTFQRKTMPKKSVVQYTCERCTRVWYLDADAPEPSVKLNLLMELDRSKDTPPGAAVRYECLCDSCSDTVQALVKSLAPLKPRQPRAKKKDEPADKENSSSTSSPSVTAEAPAAAAGSPATALPAPASAGASSVAGGQRPALSAPNHPKR